MANHHVLLGKGERHVVCLNGWFGTADAWGPFVGSLDTDAFTYAFMDYRGYGGSKGTTGDYSMKEISRDALALADALGWRTFSLVGHSMGGMAIQRVLADAPDRVEKLVGINPVPAGGVPFDDATWGFFESATENPGSRYGIIDLTTGKRLTKRWIDQMVAHSLATSTKEAFAAYLVSWAKTDFAAEIQGKTTPVLVIVGENDPALGEAAMKGTFMEWYPNAKLEVFGNAGHYPMFETPVALATSVERFLR
ncbi:MAG TPA: alpha/beta hydrolase [Polyangiaceae bacterium]|jgi:pimeloyl-ACP methyl ester carboxylesterase|nr:alpha/beta hydrolase [Polyangiaceae bacterium]